jgi:uncharacterized SAM-binding protein YcdF (DUF218 family)
MLPSDLNQASNSAITNFLFLESEPSMADFAIVLGLKAWWLPLTTVVQMYQSNLIGKFVFTGGYNHAVGVEEARAMQKEAIKLGIPHSKILIDDKATNTLENMKFSLELINKEFGLENIRAISIVAIHVHSKRALMTAKQVFPSHIKLKVVCYTSQYYTHANWQETERGKTAVYSELRKIKDYF